MKPNRTYKNLPLGKGIKYYFFCMRHAIKGWIRSFAQGWFFPGSVLVSKGMNDKEAEYG